MRIASWNVNSLKVRLEQVLEWLARMQPDVLALQETKLPDEAFPVEAFRAQGYHAAFSGQPRYNGVALLSRRPLGAVSRDGPAPIGDERRHLAASLGRLRIVNLYAVNGQAVGSEKYAYKLRYFAALRDRLAEELARHPCLIVLGDFNVAPEDRDVHDPEAWREKILCSTPERQALRALFDLGLLDTFRLFESGAGHYSWWDYRAAAYRRGLGLRIDLILASRPLAEHCVAAGIDEAVRGWPRPSDHAPVWADFDLSRAGPCRAVDDDGRPC